MKVQRAQIVLQALEARGMSKYRLRAESGVGMSIINKIVRAESYHMTSFDRVAEVLGIEVSFNLRSSLEELKKTDWYKERPEVIQKAICKIPPIQLYKFKDSGKQCQITSFEEPESGKLEDVTCTVQKNGIGGAMEEMGLGALDTNAVFGVKLDDLESWDN